MKTRTWALLIGLVLAVCLALSIWLLWPKQDAAYAEVWSEGKRIHILDLSVDREVTVTTQKGTNIITVQNGAVAVTYADCPDGYCVARGYCTNGLQIVCLPHELVIKFIGEPAVDGVAG